MAEDEPLDDARQVATAAAAAAARVIEVTARAAQDRAGSRVRGAEAPELSAALDRIGSGQRGYDHPQSREARDTARQAAGVPAEAREVRAKADLMNGTDPSRAAQGAADVPIQTAPPLKQRTREAARTR